MHVVMLQSLVSIKLSCDLMIPSHTACVVATLNLSQRSLFLFQYSVCHPRTGNFKSHNYLGMAAMFNIMAVVFNIEKMQCLVNETMHMCCCGVGTHS
jgi:hypothetical protein